MPIQRAFSDSMAKERLARGSNQSGKSSVAAVEVARAVTNQDPHKRYPAKDGVWYCVGQDNREVSNVIYKKLFRAGAFRIIRDHVTDQWRIFRPNDPADAEREDQARPAPPLIPHRFVKGIAWEDKKANVPKVITLTTGWEIHFFSSNGIPPQGVQIDGAWFDEEVTKSGWYPEVAARLVYRNGYFIWSATPQAATAELFDLHERADEEARIKAKDQRDIEEFVFLIDQNEHMTKKQRDAFAAKLSPDEWAVRIGGEFAAHSYRVFPEYSKTTHTCPYFEIPADWTKYAAIDPGRQICAVLFMAVPPPKERGDHVYLFDELYIQNCSAELFGQKMGLKTRGMMLEAMIIDHQESRKVEAGYGRSIEDQYSEALEKHGVRCHRTGTGFTWGAADPKAGIEACRAWLKAHSGNPPKLRVLEDKLPNFHWEINRYFYEQDKDGKLTDKARDRGQVHLMACLRYLVQDEPVWVPKKESKPRPGAVWLKAQELMGSKGSKSLNFGPGTITIGVGT
jgi:hypothetical protein